jgi:hypothetical protein
VILRCHAGWLPPAATMPYRKNFSYADMDLWLNERQVTEIECLVPTL